MPPALTTASSSEAETKPAKVPSFMLEMLAITLGGALGASLRHAVAVAVGVSGWHATFATAFANLLGSFLLGLVVGRLESEKTHPLLRPFLTIGVFGSFTTFSALAWDNRALAGESGEVFAVFHLVASILSGLLAFALGDILATRRSRGTKP